MAYYPRTNDNGIRGSKFWYSTTNPYYPDWQMPNCTAYAWGRTWEISPENIPYGVGQTPDGRYGDGGEWILTNSTTYKVTSIPTLGCIACFSDNSGGAGHVAIVEEMRNGTNINGLILSESGYNSFFFKYGRSVQDIINIGYTLQGYINNPFADNSTPINPPINYKKMNFIFYLNKWKRYGLK